MLWSKAIWRRLSLFKAWGGGCSLDGQEVKQQLHSSHGVPICSAFLLDNHLHEAQACLGQRCQELPPVICILMDTSCPHIWLGNAAVATVSPVAHSASWVFLGHATCSCLADWTLVLPSAWNTFLWQLSTPWASLSQTEILETTLPKIASHSCHCSLCLFHSS